jgi:hypothetical protein
MEVMPDQSPMDNMYSTVWDTLGYDLVIVDGLVPMIPSVALGATVEEGVQAEGPQDQEEAGGGCEGEEEEEEDEEDKIFVNNNHRGRHFDQGSDSDSSESEQSEEDD